MCEWKGWNTVRYSVMWDTEMRAPRTERYGKEGKWVGAIYSYVVILKEHRLNMEFMCIVRSYTHWLRPRNFPPQPPAFGLIFEDAVGQPR